MPVTLPISLNELIASSNDAAELIEPTRGPSTVVFFDFFFSDNLGRPAQDFNQFIQWNVSDGSVDFVGGVGLGVFGAPPDQPTGRYVDLGGSTGDPGQFETKLSFPVVAGQTYNLTFDYRSTEGDFNTATSSAGGQSFTVTSGSTEFRTFSQDFVATSTGLFSVSFQGLQSDTDGSGIGIDGVLFGQVLPAEDSIQFSGDTATTMIGRQGADQLYGEGGNDTLEGNAGNDRLDGGAGADVMRGGAGDDTFVVDNAGDRVIETSNQGIDTVNSLVSFSLRSTSLENVTLTGSKAVDILGNSLDNTLLGNQGANTIRGTDGDDRIVGGYSRDTLSGGADNDTFVFDQRFIRSFSFDVIADFVSSDDTMELSSRRFLDVATDADGFLTAAGFKDLSVKNARADGNDRILYDKADGDLFYDRDGSGTDYRAIKFAEVRDGTGISNTDFLVV